MKKRILFYWFLLGLLVTVVSVFAQGDSKTPLALDVSANEPVKYVGSVQPDPYFYDGRLPHVVGAHSYQVFRANRTHPAEGGEVGFTYNHQPYLAYWNGQFYVQFLSGQVQEHTPPTRLMLLTSKDGRMWSKPVVLFPEYSLPEIKRGDIYIPQGTKSVMHQRMGFYVAQNGRLLTSGFYSYSATPRHSPNKGQGLGRVVREIYKDNTFAPIYFIRYNRHAGFNENNTNFPFYKTSKDKGFVAACEDLLANKLITLQWWEEDRGKDGFFVMDPSQVKDEDVTATQAGVTTSAGAGKAFSFFRRPDGVIVGLWKNQYSALSPDEGKTWTPIVKNETLMTCGAKTWGQRTEDGRYALVYDHSATRRNRFPLVVMTSDNGHEFDHMLCVQGEVPPMRYQGLHKNPGPQYIRGIIEGNGNPPGNEMWLTYSMNKEDIWVARVPVPVTEAVSMHLDENFESAQSEADLTWWNLYMPKWARIRIGQIAGTTNKYLELLDEAPYDYARAERVFPASKAVTVGFRVLISEVRAGSALEVEVQDRSGARPMRLRFDQAWLGLDRDKVFPLTPVKISTGTWYDIQLELDCGTQSYNLAVNGEWLRKNVAFAETVQSLARLVFRTGPYRGEVPKTLAEKGEPKPAGLYREDLPGADQKVAKSRFLIDDVKTAGQ